MIVPQSWTNLLFDLQSKTSNGVVIGGGALRDLDHGKKIKDLDIFIGAGDGDEALGLNKLLGGKPMEDPEAQMYPANMSEIQLVTDAQIEFEIPVQFIFINWRIDSIVERFDYGLCQIAYDGREVRASANYEVDKDNKTMTLVRCDNDYALGRSVERFARWKPRYPDHRFVLGCNLNFGVDNSCVSAYP